MLTVLRDGSEVPSYMARIRSCSYPAGLMEHAAVNALADGKPVAVTTAAMDFIETDEELAYLLGHELALAARAGSDAAGVSTFWWKMNARSPGAAWAQSLTHPDGASHLHVLDATAGRNPAERDSGRQLVPNLRP